MAYRLLVLNPGSTSTKAAIYEDEHQLAVKNMVHTNQDLAPYPTLYDQLDYRVALVRLWLAQEGFDLTQLSAVVGRGGIIPNIVAGGYVVDDNLTDCLLHHTVFDHASNLGGLMAREFAEPLRIPAYIYDGVTVDELLPINKLTGLPSMRRKGMGHNLNTRAAALRYARENGRDYKDITVIVAHLGGGISVNLHHNGKIEDFINDEEGPFSPERAGGLPMFDVIKECFSGRYDYKGMMKLVKNQGGLMAHLGTTDSRAVEQMIQSGDAHAKLVYDAMILNIAKNIAKCAPKRVRQGGRHPPHRRHRLLPVCHQRD